MKNALAISVALAASSTAGAEIIISNLNAPVSAGTAFGPAATTEFKAGGFTMNAGVDYFLDAVTIAVEDALIGEVPDIQLWSGAAAPDTFIADLSGPAFNALVADFTYTPDSQLVLQDGATYWVYINNTPPVADFVWAGGTDLPSGTAASSAGYIFNGGPSSFFNRFEVEGTVVPTPASAGLLGIAGLAATRRRR